MHLNSIKNKVIVITGGTSGVGREFVRQLYNDNQLIIVARNTLRLIKLKEEFSLITTYGFDLSDVENYQKLAAEILAGHQKIDLLINNTAVQFTPKLIDQAFDYQTINQEININFNAICSLCYLLLPALIKATPSAAILNINTGLAIAPKTNSAIYCASKSALNTFSTCLAYQLENTSVRVAQAFLPLVDTPMTETRTQKKLAPSLVVEEILAGLVKRKNHIDVGKVKLLRLISQLMPPLARKIMKGS